MSVLNTLRRLFHTVCVRKHVQHVYEPNNHALPPLGPRSAHSPSYDEQRKSLEDLRLKLAYLNAQLQLIEMNERENGGTSNGDMGGTH